MTAPRTQTFTLTPHPAGEGSAVRAIGGRLSRTADGLEVTYVLEGDLEGIRVPERCEPRFADGLWRHTCFELFVASLGEPRYHEFNWSPSGEWAVYAFDRYREPSALALEPESIDQNMTVRRSSGRLELDTVAPLDRLSPRYADGRLMLGLAAVIEDRNGSLAYWALNHPRPRPDFHHPDAFVLEL